jgi:hypothetical protein
MGFVYFAAAKYLGYTAFCRLVIQPQCARSFVGHQADGQSEIPPIPSPWKGGAIRTLIGVTIGAIVGLGFWKIPYFADADNSGNIFFFILLVPIRIVEWQLLLRWAYRDFHFDVRALRVPVLGMLASFALDGLGILAAFVLPGGLWIC